MTFRTGVILLFVFFSLLYITVMCKSFRIWMFCFRIISFLKICTQLHFTNTGVLLIIKKNLLDNHFKICIKFIIWYSSKCNFAKFLFPNKMSEQSFLSLKIFTDLLKLNYSKCVFEKLFILETICKQCSLSRSCQLFYETGKFHFGKL